MKRIYTITPPVWLKTLSDDYYISNDLINLWIVKRLDKLPYYNVILNGKTLVTNLTLEEAKAISENRYYSFIEQFLSPYHQE